MTKKEKHSSDELISIPGVGPSISKDLHSIGIDKVADLKEADPQDLYNRLCISNRMQVDRCVLYVFRCAVYFASNSRHDPELLKWWNWKNREL